ncbi:MAG: hypothetical protein KGO81_07615 [Bacteroidota bacterium]|nr:hypothetical protein [Bacteroidota bacterium]
MNKQLLLIVLLIAVASCTFAQQRSTSPFVTVSGTVYDISARRPLEAVAVLSTSGRGTLTDSLGHYSFTVKTTDSIWFSLLNKTTMRYPVDTIQNTSAFDVMIHLRAADLPEVKVRNRNYRLDSIQNRKDYAKYFDFKKPTFKLSTNPGYTPGGVTVGLDLDELINMFRFRRTRNLEALQQRLIQQEEDKYIDHRFSKLFVKKVTKLDGTELDNFMAKYRPEYIILLSMNDLELGYYIEKCFEQYSSLKEYQKKYLHNRSFQSPY